MRARSRRVRPRALLLPAPPRPEHSATSLLSARSQNARGLSGRESAIVARRIASRGASRFGQQTTSRPSCFLVFTHRYRRALRSSGVSTTSKTMILRTPGHHRFRSHSVPRGGRLAQPGSLWSSRAVRAPCCEPVSAQNSIHPSALIRQPIGPSAPISPSAQQPNSQLVKAGGAIPADTNTTSQAPCEMACSRGGEFRFRHFKAVERLGLTGHRAHLDISAVSQRPRCLWLLQILARQRSSREQGSGRSYFQRRRWFEGRHALRTRARTASSNGRE